jgi:hypothetical protein
MRLWSLHPQYLDARGLTALWREALLAQAVLRGRTRGYRHHPQLQRFAESHAPRAAIACYLRAVQAEAERRGYRFDAAKIGRAGGAGRGTGPGSGSGVAMLTVARAQLQYEWRHLRRKLASRAPAWLASVAAVSTPRPHPLFRVVRGGIASWEIIAGG